MQLRQVMLLLSMAWISCSLAGPTSLGEPSPTAVLLDSGGSNSEPPQLNAAVSLMVEANLARQEEGLEPLRPRPDLMDVARQRGEDMIERGYFDHVDPDSGSVEAQRLMREQGYTGELGELLFATTVDLHEVPRATIRAWSDSEDNRQTLLDPDYQYTGATLVRSEAWWYVVQVLAERSP